MPRREPRRKLGKKQERKKWKRPDLRQRDPISLRVMPPVSRALFERISEIWRISPEKLETTYSRKNLTKTGDGHFSPLFGIVYGSTKRHVLEHELFHLAQEFLLVLTEKERAELRDAYGEISDKKKHSPEKVKAITKPKQEDPELLKKWLANNELSEATAKNWQRGRWIGFRSYSRKRLAVYTSSPILFAISKIVPSNATVAASMVSALGVLASESHTTYKNYMVRKYFKTHGVDGMILLFVNPPEKFNYKKTAKWAQKMVEQGYLSPRGGLTEKGLRFVRSKQPRENILERASQFRKIQMQRMDHGVL